MRNLLVLPIMIPLLMAALCLGFRGRTQIQRLLFAFGTWAHLAVTFSICDRIVRGPAMRMQLGGWSSPFAIELALDRTSAIFLISTSLIAAVLGSHLLSEGRNALDRRGRLSVYLMLLGGISGVFLTADMFNMFVWFELTMLCSFVLLAMGGHRDQLEGSLKYVVLNLVASTLLLCALGYLYGSLGSLSMRQISAISHAPKPPASIPVLASLFAVSFSIKAALFPFSSWLPASYHTASPTTNALMASTLTKLGVYSLIRLFAEVFPIDSFNRGMCLAFGVGSILFGGLGALVQDNFRRLISFIVIAQVGVLVVGVTLATEMSYTGSLFLAANEMIALAGLILLIGRLELIFQTTKLSEMGGLSGSYPVEAAWLGILMMSVAGFPGLAGFFGKVALLRGVSDPVLTSAILLGSFLTLAAFVRVWVKVAWRPCPPGAVQRKIPSESSYALLAGIGLLLVVFANPILDQCRMAASELVRSAKVPKP